MTKHAHKHFLFTALAVSLLSCSEMRQESPAAGNGKILECVSRDASENTLLVKAGEGFDRDALAGGRIRTCSPLFPGKARNEKAAQKWGLDRWYIVEFEEGCYIREEAARLAEMPEITTVQFNGHMTHSAPEEAHVCDEMPLTRSAVSGQQMFDDPMLPYQWNLINTGNQELVANSVAGADVGVKDAWRLATGDRDIIVAVFDCGIKHGHEDLKDAMWINEGEIPKNGKDDDNNGYIDDVYGFNFYHAYPTADGKWEGDPIDWTQGIGHGTHVAGIIGAVNGNGKGISSIAGGSGNADGVRLMSCQMFNSESTMATAAQVAQAFRYAADNGACIAQCSWGTDGSYSSDERYINSSSAEYAALQYFLDPENSNHPSLRGNIAVFAAGNHAKPNSGYPGALPGCISVTSLDAAFLPSGFTNYGPGCKIAAPGGDILAYDGNRTTYHEMILSIGCPDLASGSKKSPAIKIDGQENARYVYMRGTSMACPHVAGVLALGISYAKKLGKTFTREEMMALLLSSAEDIDGNLAQGEKTYYTVENNAYVSKTVSLSQYRGKMGTGAVDAWSFLMAIEGTPSIFVRVGEDAEIALGKYIGHSSGIEHLEISMDEASRNSLGLTAAPRIENGKLILHCNRTGAGKITVTARVGKDHDTEGGISGMEYKRELSIVSRPFATNNGGWF